MHSLQQGWSNPFITDSVKLCLTPLPQVTERTITLKQNEHLVGGWVL